MGLSLSSYSYPFHLYFKNYDDTLNYYYNINKQNPCIDASLNKISYFDTNHVFKFYKLYIYIDPSVSDNIKKRYEQKAFDNNMLVDSYLESYNNINASAFCYDAGFDLFCPDDLNITTNDDVIMLDHKIKCCMKVCSQDTNIEHFVGYYLYCRSSTGLKTPLRLANSVGIIDSGYRGNIKACFDYKYNNLQNPYLQNPFKLEAGSRYTQICPPNLEHPMKVYIVYDIEDLGNSTLRQSNGFGSSGT